MNSIVGWAYFDTSVLLKRYVAEAGTPHAGRLLKKYRILSSALAPVEALSAIRRRRLAGDLEEKDFAAIRTRILKDRVHWELVEITAAVLDLAEHVLFQTEVRTLDALHLASALMFQTSSGSAIPFITADREQRVAAEQLGLSAVFLG